MFDDRDARELLEPLHADDRAQLRLRHRGDRLAARTSRRCTCRRCARWCARPRRGLPTVGRRPARRRAAGGPARARDLRRRGRGARRHRRALLRLAARRRRCRRVDRALWLALLGARVGGWVVAGPALARELQPRLLPRVPRPAGRRAARAARDALQRLHPAARAPRRGPPHPRSTARAATAWSSSPARSTSWCEPLAHLADELVAARLVERRRALHRRARRAAADAPTGARRWPRGWPPSTAWTWPTATPTATPSPTCRCSSWSATRVAVNPDFRLAREARRRGWRTFDWSVEPGARSRPPAPTEVAV